MQEYLSKTGHVYSPAYPTMGKRVYESMDPEIVAVLEETARELSAWAREQGEADDARLEELLVEGGMTMNVADREAFVEASQPVYEAFAEEVDGGKEMIDAAISLAPAS